MEPPRPRLLAERGVKPQHPRSRRSHERQDQHCEKHRHGD